MKTIQQILGLSDKELIKAEMAISQMRDKGYLTTEDFVFQLSEVLPGALNILSNVLCISMANTHSLLRKGYISASVLDDFISEYTAKMQKTHINIGNIKVGDSGVYTAVFNDYNFLVAGIEIEFNLEKMLVLHKDKVVGILVLEDENN